VGQEFYNLKANELDDSLVARDFRLNLQTATEVNERKIQASNRVRPLLVRLEHEDLNKMGERFRWNKREGCRNFPMKKRNSGRIAQSIRLRVHFSGQMAKMQRLQEIVNSDLLFQKAMQLAQVDQSILDRMNLENLLMEDAKMESHRLW
jgi:hypothetical protein